jgi:hypothetical protein
MNEFNYFIFIISVIFPYFYKKVCYFDNFDQIENKCIYSHISYLTLIIYKFIFTNHMGFFMYFMYLRVTLFKELRFILDQENANFLFFIGGKIRASLKAFILKVKAISRESYFI